MQSHHKRVEHESIVEMEQMHVRRVQHEHLNELHKQCIIRQQLVVQYVDVENGVMHEQVVVVI